MSQGQGGGPPLLRPIPRRPFGLNLREPTPPEDDPFTPPPEPDQSPALNLESLNSRLLESWNNASSESTSVSRAQSVLNLTGSTLMGIYSPTTYGGDRFYMGTDEPTTPWGTGAETPAKGLDADDPHYEIQKERAQPKRRRSSLHQAPRPQPLSTSEFVSYLGFRVLLLSGLGVLYGMLVAQFHDRQKATAAFQMGAILKSADGKYDWRYMMFWGTFGVVLGSLLPWFDGIWEKTFGEDVVVESAAEHTLGGDKQDKSTSSIDWALAVRGVGAFVGIAFAIRRLPWDSTLQVSLTLALANPVLWFLIDRSMAGFILAAAVGIAGSTVLMGLKPDMVPVPASPSTLEGYNQQNVTGDDIDQLVFGGLVSQETVATSIWMMSVLFCCCVCFGNIGRWLAMNRSATGKGRWAQRR